MKAHDFEEKELVPEREWWKRTKPVLTIGIPQELRDYFFEIKRRFGLDIANLILIMYKTSPAVAMALARRILEYDSFEDLMLFLEGKIEMFDQKSRSILANVIFRFKYNYYLERLRHAVENEPEDIRMDAVRLFNRLASIGVFFDPVCIVQYVHWKRKGGSPPKRCRAAIRQIQMLEKELERG